MCVCVLFVCVYYVYVICCVCVKQHWTEMQSTFGNKYNKVSFDFSIKYQVSVIDLVAFQWTHVSPVIVSEWVTGTSPGLTRCRAVRTSDLFRERAVLAEALVGYTGSACFCSESPSIFKNLNTISFIS